MANLGSAAMVPASADARSETLAAASRTLPYGAMGWARSAVAVGFLSVLVACGEQSADRGPDEMLAAAVERTLAAQSFQIRSLLTDGREQHVSEVEYVAPDRVRIRLRPASRTILIGGDTYLSTPEEPDRFVHVETRCDSMLEVAVPALSIVREATEVRRNGPVFVFRSDAVEGMIGQARVEDGHLASLLLRYELPDVNRRMIERYSFSRFGANISIEPPPASSIVPDAGGSPKQVPPAPCP
jgi:hypothetical protein